MHLTDEQRELILEWLAAGAHKWPEIKARAAAHDRPFDVSYPQFKGLRARAGVEVKKLRAENDAAAMSKGLAVKARRVAAYKGIATRILNLIDDRAEEMGEEVAGGNTGLLVRDYKGKDADQPVYKVDTATLKELREYLKQIAIEIGDWTEKTALTTPDGKESLLDPLVAAFEKAYGNGAKPTTETN